MMNLIYSLIIFPLLVLFSHIYSIFSGRIRKPLYERYKTLTKLKKWRAEDYDSSKKVIIIHSSSMGEFEHIKPLISKLSQEFNVQIIVTFFSPSGYENVKAYDGVNLFLYLPFDFKFIWEKFYYLTHTEILIISKHDVWPNQIKIAKRKGICTILVNASLNEKSSRNSLIARLILSSAYRGLSKIFVISEQDSQQFGKSFTCTNTEVVGDTKFDQVFKRQKESIDHQLIDTKWLKDNLFLILGSLWPQDAEHVLKPIPILLQKFAKLKIIIVPHQPTAEYIALFVNYFKEQPYSLFRSNFENDETRILIINRIGILADLYKYADIAFVGGSFKQGIHNVMEPAVYGLPVLFGPVHNNSYEARRLVKKGGAIVINDADSFYMEVEKLINVETERKAIGSIALSYATKNSGGTDKIIEFVRSIIN